MQKPTVNNEGYFSHTRPAFHYMGVLGFSLLAHALIFMFLGSVLQIQSSEKTSTTLQLQIAKSSSPPVATETVTETETETETATETATGHHSALASKTPETDVVSVEEKPIKSEAIVATKGPVPVVTDTEKIIEQPADLPAKINKNESIKVNTKEDENKNEGAKAEVESVSVDEILLATEKTEVERLEHEESVDNNVLASQINNTAVPSIENPPTDPSQYKSATFQGPPPVVIRPALATRKRQTGEVILRGFLSEEGQLSNVTIYQSSGHELLDSAAQSQAIGWQYQPAIVGGQPTGLWVQIPVVFR